jgi:diguanylate cyclase (GGDEF)-like protein
VSTCNTTSKFVELSAEQIAQCLEQARAAQREARLEEGLALAEQAWAASQQQGYLAEQVEAGRLRSFFRFRRGDLPGMLAAGQEVLPLMRPLGAQPWLCELLRWMSLAASEIGDFETGLACANEGCALAQELGDVRIQAVALNALGASFERMGDPWQAERLMNEAAALVRDQATPYEHVVTFNNLCSVALGAYHLMCDSGNDEACQQALERGLHYARAVRPHARELGDPFALALTDGNLGEVLMLLGVLDEAQSFLDAALEQAQSLGYQNLAWRTRCSLAELMLARGEAREAWHIVQALQADAAGQLPAFVALRLHHSAFRAARALGRSDDALAHLECYQRLERQRSVAQLMAQSRFFVTRLEAEQVRAQAHRAVDALTARTEELEAHAQRDPLTGLGNRRCLESRMPALMADAEARGRPLTLALIDADHFKSVNDRHGHAVGDQVLQLLAQMLRDNTRGSDLLLRYGGEEFLVVFPDTVADRAFEVCERLRANVETHPWDELAPGLQVSLSIGLASAPPYSTDMLIARADAAMYRAKHLGRNRVALA